MRTEEIINSLDVRGCPFYDIVTCDYIGILEYLLSEVEE